LQKLTLVVAGPVFRALSYPLSYFKQGNTGVETLADAKATVQKLQAQLADLTLKNQLLEHDKEDNDRLREMLGFRQDAPYRLRACRVISRDPTTFWDVVQIDIGWKDEPDLKPDQPVVTPRGVVGKVGQVSPYVADVILMVNPNCQISAVVANTRDQGFAEGEGNAGDNQPRLKVTLLPKNSPVAVGNFVDTSGLGPFFPAGLHLGTVTEVIEPTKKYPTFGLYKEVYLDPTADLNQLDELFVILSSNNPEDQNAHATPANLPPQDPNKP
jgi:rod shape-determining protein MreC